MSHPKSIIRDNTIKRLFAEGKKCDVGALESALNKAGLWAKHAYGSLDWQQYLDESVDVIYYYEESLNQRNDSNSFNHQNARAHRKIK